MAKIMINNKLYAEKDNICDAMLLIGAKYGAVKTNSMIEDKLIVVNEESQTITVEDNRVCI